MQERKKHFLHAVTTVILTLTLGLTGVGMSWAQKANKFVPDDLLVQIKSGTSKADIDSLLKSHGAKTADEIEKLKIRRVKVPAHALEKVKAALARNPNVNFVENNYIAEAGFEPNDDKYPSQWHLPKISAPGAWDFETGATTTPIAIIDSGVDPTHPDLAYKLIDGYNFIGNNTDTHDVRGHGTAVAGAAAAMTDNVAGVAGVVWDSPIMPLVVLNADDWASYYDIARAITFAADKGVRVMNISIGGSSSSTTLQNAVNYAWNKGAVIFACAQNYATSTPYYPAACANVVAVSATTSTDTRASFSNYGDWVDIAAPGVSILTTNNGGSYGSWSGTSFSSPIAAGVAALILSANPSLTNAQVVDIITRNADDLGTAGFDPYFGYGRINAHLCLAAAVASAPETDATAPSVTIMTPSDGATVSGGVSVEVQAMDDGGIDRVDLYLDGALLATDNAAPHQFYWDTTSYADATYELLAIAYDGSNNEGKSAYVIVILHNEIINEEVAPEEPVDVDVTAPVVTITSPRDGAYISDKEIINAVASDSDGIRSMELYLDGNLLRAADYKSTLAVNWNTRKESAGAHTLLVRAIDAAGNTGEQTITVFK